jgi:hypothetical protein
VKVTYILVTYLSKDAALLQVAQLFKLGAPRKDDLQRLREWLNFEQGNFCKAMSERHGMRNSITIKPFSLPNKMDFHDLRLPAL